MGWNKGETNLLVQTGDGNFMGSKRVRADPEETVIRLLAIDRTFPLRKQGGVLFQIAPGFRGRVPQPFCLFSNGALRDNDIPGRRGDTLGYVAGADESLEPGFEKGALFDGNASLLPIEAKR